MGNKAKQSTWIGLAALATGLFASAAHGQAFQSPSEQIRQPELQQQQLTLAQSLLSPTSGPVNGDDLILLDDSKLFYVRFGLSGGYTSNAFVTRDEEHDWLLLGTAEAGAQTVLENGVGLRLGANVQDARYARFQELNFDSIGGVAEVSKQVGPFMLSLDFTPTSYHSTTFADQLLITYPITLSAVYQKQLAEKWMFTGIGSVSYTWANPDQYEDAALDYNASVAYQPWHSIVFQGGVDARFVFYRDFYGEVFNKDRRDAIVTPFIGAIWTPTDFLTVSANLSYGQSYSTLSEYEYDSFNFTPSVQAVFRF